MTNKETETLVRELVKTWHEGNYVPPIPMSNIETLLLVIDEARELLEKWAVHEAGPESW